MIGRNVRFTRVHASTKHKERDRVNEDIRRFVESGHSIVRVAPGATGVDSMRAHTFTINGNTHFAENQ